VWIPSYLLSSVNNKLQSGINGYQGSAKNIQLSVLTGSYTLHDITLYKTASKIPDPFFSATKLKVSIEWSALFHGGITGKVILDHAILNFVKGPTQLASQTSIPQDWKKVVSYLAYVPVNSFEIKEGEIHFIDFHQTPNIDLRIEQLHMLGTNLMNASGEENALPGNVVATGKVYDGILQLASKVNIIQQTPSFELRAELSPVSLQHFNNFFKAYGNYDIQNGAVGFKATANTRDDKIVVHCTPSIADIEVASWNADEDKDIYSLVNTDNGSVSWEIKNAKTDSEMILEGDLTNSNSDLVTVLGETLKNIFVNVVVPTLEKSAHPVNRSKIINTTPSVIDQVSVGRTETKKKNLFNRIFKKKEDREKRKKERKKDRKKKKDQEE
jgi:hypothetical protein